MDWMSEGRPAFGDGLLPVIVQHADDGTVLMLGWANDEALAATERTSEAHFWSRSRDRLWRKGETSGNTMRVIEIGTDCDADAILYRVRPSGPACHTGTRSCFGEASRAGGLRELEATINARRGADPAASYTARLLSGGPRRPAEKVVEEAGEVAAASLAGTDDELAAEAADLLYHLLVVLAARDLSLDRVLGVLEARRSAPQAG
jgi:phosphoribosyl-ATP pyrophosphohydrolase/phosphoribosyl-AMP cyclohydrolase